MIKNIISITILVLSLGFNFAHAADAPSKKAAGPVTAFEKTILESQKSKDYLPAFKAFANTKFFVLVNADKNAKQGDKIKKFDFVIAQHPQKPEIPVMVISEDIQRLAGIQEGRISAIQMSGAELVVSIHPEVSLAVAMQSGIFEMDKKLVGMLRESIKKSAANQVKKK